MSELIYFHILNSLRFSLTEIIQKQQQQNKWYYIRKIDFYSNGNELSKICLF